MQISLSRVELAAALIAVVAVGIGAGGSSAAVPGIPALYVNYNPDCTFTLTVDGGISVTSSSAPGPTLPPGVYQLLVTMPNPGGGYSCVAPVFTLTGPGVSAKTVFQGQQLEDDHVIPALQPSSTYVAQDASAPAATQKVFTTAASGSNSVLLGGSPGGTQSNGSGGSTQTDVVGSAADQYQGALVATVGKTGAATLLFEGAKVDALAAGEYDIRVTDDAKGSGFSIEERGHKPLPITAAAFVGRRTQRVTLASGRWVYFAGAGKPAAFIVAN